MIITVQNRLLTPHFSVKELSCRCRRPDCNAPPMKPGLLSKLESLRVDYGKPLVVTSGSRCSIWNQLVGGAPDSQHVLGNAVDLHFEAKDQLRLVGILAEKHGFGGIGTGKKLLHLDDRGYAARWIYSDR